MLAAVQLQVLLYARGRVLIDPRLGEPAPDDPDQLRVQLEGEERGVGPQARDHLVGEDARPGPVLDDDLCSLEVAALDHPARARSSSG